MKDLKLRDLKLQDLSACVVAWHNSHPLARRITGAHVQSVGYVVLPYLGAAAGPAAMLPPLGADSAENALMAEIYTFPAGAAAQDGTVDLTVEAEVTAANCGRDVAAQSIQIMPGAEPAVMDLTMTMPDCSAVGEYLVLNNMLQDLTLAAN